MSVSKNINLNLNEVKIMSEENKKEEMSSILQDKMEGLFDAVIQGRKEYYQDNQVPTKNEIEGIVSKYGYLNAGVSGTIGLIPGPWGMAAAIPEVIAVINNQLKMIYDIGMAYGKEDVLTKELLMAIFATGMGSGGIGLLSIHGSKVLVKRASLRILQKIIEFLGGKITQKVLKSMIAKWLPFVGAAGMAAWSKYSTTKIGEYAKEILSKEIEFDSNELTETDIVIEDAIVIDEVENITIEAKINALINLMKADNRIHEKEVEYIDTLIEKSNLDDSINSKLKENMKSTEIIKVDYNLFKDDPSESVGLISDLISLAKRDGEFHIKEKIFVKQVGKTLNYSENDLNEMMNL